MEESSPRVDPDIEKVRSKTNKTDFKLELLQDFTYDKTSIKFLGMEKTLLEGFLTCFFLFISFRICSLSKFP